MALRVLWLKSNAPDTWRLLDMLMDHAEVTDREDKMINGVVDFILNVCKLNFTGGKKRLSSKIKRTIEMFFLVKLIILNTEEDTSFLTLKVARMCLPS